MSASVVHVATVDEARFLGHLKSMFSSSTKVLAELMQNARRAKATKVDFEFDPETATLVVTDNGCGIDTFRAILTVAESGWAEDVQAAEHPYGLGFFSVVFGAESILVESKGRAIRFTSDDLINKAGIPERGSDFIGGTRVSLIGMHLQPKIIESALKSFALGFAIPVFWNGAEMERPHAADVIGGVDTSVGRMRIYGLDARQPHYSKNFVVYCQGLPIHVGDLPQDRHGNNHILHLDHHRFLPRLPDRDAVIDGEAAATEIQEVLRGLWASFLSEQKRDLPAEAFADKFWDLAKQLKMLDIMNDVGVIPQSQLSCLDRYPVITGWGESCFGSYPEHLTRHQVESGEILLFEELDGEEYGLNWLKLHVAYQIGLVFLGGQLPEGHWAAPHVRNLSDVPVKVRGTTKAKEYFSGRWASGTVRVLQGFEATMLGSTVEMTHAVCVGRESDDATFLIPDRDGDFSRVLCQASDYINSDDQFQGTDMDLDQAEFSDQVAEMRGQPPEVTVRKLLDEIKNKPALHGRSFTVHINNQGEVSVLAA